MEPIRQLSDYEQERGKPLPGMNHGALQISLGAALSRHGEKYSVLAEVSLELDGRPYVPDIVVYPKLALDPRRDQVKNTEPPLTVVRSCRPPNLWTT